MSEVPKLLHNEAARALAQQLTLTGLALAYRANEAHHAHSVACAERRRLLDESLAAGSELTETRAILDGTRPTVTATSLCAEDIENAAGKLIGRETLGGDYLAESNGNLPVFNADGSYTAGAWW